MAVISLFRREDPDLKDLRERWEESREARLTSVEPQWHLNLAFFMGEQWVEWNPATRRLVKPDVPSWRVMAVTNMVQSTIRTEFGKLTRQRPLLGVDPRGPEPERQAQARAADKIREYLWDAQDTYDQMKDALLWALICGTGFVKVYWDNRAGDLILDEETGEYLPIGDLCTIACSPFEIYPDPLASSFKDAAWVIHAKVRSVEWVEHRYGVRVEPEDITQLQYLGTSLLSLGRHFGQAPSLKNAVLLLEYWERPTPSNPNGRYTLFTQSRIIYDGEHPYLEAGVIFPFARMRHIRVPGRFWGESVIRFIMDPQVQFNKTRSQMIEARNLMVKPKWLIPKGSMDQPPTTMPGEILWYTPVAGLKPEPVFGGDIPSSMYHELEELRNEIYELTGQHEVSRAINPQGVRSGIAIAYLQEQDDTRLHPSAEEFEKMGAEVQRMQLRLARVFYTEPRKGRIIGPNNEVEIIEFSGKDIPEDVDVVVQSGSSLPPGRVARQEFVMQLWAARIIQDPRVVLRLLEFGNVEGLYEDLNLDIAQAQRENERLKNGDPNVVVEDFHNHEVHIYEHDKFRKTAEYEALPPEIKELFRRHVEEHRRMWQQEALGSLGGVTGQQQEQQPGSLEAIQPMELPNESLLSNLVNPGEENEGGVQ